MHRSPGGAVRPVPDESSDSVPSHGIHRGGGVRSAHPRRPLRWELSCLVSLLSLLFLRPVLAGEDALQRELLSGVRQFRAERYDEALATFRHLRTTRHVREIDFYLGLTLHKLERHEEALLAFRAARAAGLTEPLTDYYEAVSCYRLGMVLRARQRFAALLVESPADAASRRPPPLGPRLREGAQRFLQAIDEAPSPTAAQAETVLLRAEALLPVSPQQAQEWLDEAVLLSDRLSAAGDRYLAVRTRALLQRVGGPPLTN